MCSAEHARRTSCHPKLVPLRCCLRLCETTPVPLVPVLSLLAQCALSLDDPGGRGSLPWAEERSHRHVSIVSTWADCGHARGDSCIGEIEAAAYLFLGASCNRRLGRTGTNRCCRE